MMEWSFVFNSQSDDSKSGFKEYEVTGGCGPLIASAKHIAETSSADVLASRNGAPRLANRRILVVEDEIFIAMATVDALVASGAEVVGPAMSVLRGLELLDSETELDGAILDVNVDDQLVFRSLNDCATKEFRSFSTRLISTARKWIHHFPTPSFA